MPIMGSELISVIIPVYNTEKYLKRCIESIINQTYENIQIILIDDGSTDGSGAICDEFSENNHRIVVCHTENKGQGAARNYGIKVAAGKYIGFVDSDDYIEKDMYEVLYNNLIRYNADISTCGYWTVKAEDLDKAVFSDKHENIQVLNAEEAISLTLNGDKYYPVLPVVKLYKAEIFLNVAFPEKMIYEDHYIIIEILEQCRRIVVTSKKEYYYIFRKNSTTHTFTKKNLDAIAACRHLYKMVIKKYPNLKESAEYKLLWSYFICLDLVMLSDNEKKYIQIEKKLTAYIRRHFLAVICNKHFRIYRKSAAFLLAVNRNLYKIALILGVKLRGE